MGEPNIFDYLLTKPEGNCSNKCCEKIYGTEETYETYLPENDIQKSFHSTHFSFLLNQNTIITDLPIFVNPSNLTLPYSTFLQAKNSFSSH